VLRGAAGTAWNGFQSPVLDLDFEGRVIVADVLPLAASSIRISS
jgi:leucyl aminopeptidase